VLFDEREKWRRKENGKKKYTPSAGLLSLMQLDLRGTPSRI
jgi:hypothetical protein